MSGTVVSVSGNVITLSSAGDEVEHKVQPGATITLDGKPAKLGDLKAGDEVSLSGDPATSVSATRP